MKNLKKKRFICIYIAGIIKKKALKTWNPAAGVNVKCDGTMIVREKVGYRDAPAPKTV